jgi:hypothetical protein
MATVLERFHFVAQAPNNVKGKLAPQNIQEIGRQKR